MATIFIPSLLRKLTAGKSSVTASGTTVGQLITDLDRQFPGFRRQMIEDGELKPSLAVSVDGEIGTQGLLEPVQEDSQIYILPAIGGGT